MSSLNLGQEELKAVEQSRQRLSQLSNSIGSLKTDVFNSNPLPNLESLQNSADILQLNLRALLDIVSQHNDLFSRVAVHPSTNFPGRTQEGILLQLLRKKPEPDVAATMDKGRETLAGLTSLGGPVTDSGAVAVENAAIKDQEKELEDTWAEARDACMKRIIEYAMNEESDPFTAEERETGIENVRTGLRRTFEDEYEEDEEEEGEGDDDVMEVDRPPPPPAAAVNTQEVEGMVVENIMRFAVRGEFMAG